MSAWFLTSQAQAANTNQIPSVSPSSAPQGTTNLLVTFMLNATPTPPPTNVPATSASIGTIAGASLTHPSQTAVTATFSIPGNAPWGPGCHDLLSGQRVLRQDRRVHQHGGHDAYLSHLFSSPPSVSFSFESTRGSCGHNLVYLTLCGFQVDFDRQPSDFGTRLA